MSSSSSPVTRDAVSSAVSSLTKQMQTRSADSESLSDDFLALQLSLRFIPGKLRVNPFLLSLPHPLSALSVCLITDDRPNCPPASSFLDKGKELNLPIANSIGFSVIRSDCKEDEERLRIKLKGSYDLFLAEKRILPLLVKLLGKGFFAKKNLLPVNFSRPGWPEQIKRILNSTCFYLKSGTCSGIRVGRLCMGVEEIVDNVMRVIDEAVEKVPNKWEHVRAFHLKAVGSSALPIYQALTEIALKTEVGEKENLESGEVLNEDEDGVKEKSEKTSEKKGKKKKEGEKENKEKRKKQEKDGEEEKKEENEGEDVKVKGGKKGKNDNLEGQNVKGDEEKMKKKKRSEGEMVEATEKKGKRTKIKV
ncbi:hypothetical protein LUZ60_008189 [Juncus effusus]|nr:hypothetical protein LUZ60_008189 [Juncus effusus]